MLLFHHKKIKISIKINRRNVKYKYPFLFIKFKKIKPSSRGYKRDKYWPRISSSPNSPPNLPLVYG